MGKKTQSCPFVCLLFKCRRIKHLSRRLWEVGANLENFTCIVLEHLHIKRSLLVDQGLRRSLHPTIDRESWIKQNARNWWYFYAFVESSLFYRCTFELTAQKNEYYYSFQFKVWRHCGIFKAYSLVQSYKYRLFIFPIICQRQQFK